MGNDRTNICAEEDQLFEEWGRVCGIPTRLFHPDGIIDPDRFNAAKKRICFLMKEPNNPPGESHGSGFDFRDRWREEVKYAFSFRIAEWAVGLLEHFPTYDRIWAGGNGRAHDALRSVALVNIKKTGGGGSSDYMPFMNALGATAAKQDITVGFVRRQLRLIKPELVIMGLSWEGLRQRMFPDVEWRPTGYQVDVGSWEGCVLVDFYHPSARNAPAAAYCLLEKVHERLQTMGLSTNG